MEKRVDLKEPPTLAARVAVVDDYLERVKDVADIGCVAARVPADLIIMVYENGWDDDRYDAHYDIESEVQAAHPDLKIVFRILPMEELDNPNVAERLDRDD